LALRIHPSARRRRIAQDRIRYVIDLLVILAMKLRRAYLADYARVMACQGL
jgi:hypothetical protein